MVDANQDQTESAAAPPKSVIKAAYRRRGRQLIKRAISELTPALGHPPQPDQLVDWLIALKKKLVASSFRQYKASMLAAFQFSILQRRKEAAVGAISNGEAAILLLEAAMKRLAAEPQTGCKKETCLTSSQKAKQLPNDDHLLIEKTLQGSNSKYRDALIDYLIANVRTGLRPQEWRQVTILQDDDEAFTLLVLNLKSDDVRAHGEHRTLRFVNLPLNDRAAICRWVQTVIAAGEDGVTKLLSGLGDLLARTDRLIWPRRKQHYTLYSGRHEFAALAKLVYAPEEVAALMGHASDLTATSHYGRYRKGAKLPPEIQRLIDMLPVPDPSEVARVRHRLADSLARLQSGLGTPRASARLQARS